MTKFRTQYGEHLKTKSEAGKELVQNYELRIDEYGHEELRETDMTNLQAEIQSHRDSVDFNLIIARYMMGDVDALEKLHGFYADVSELPVSMAEIMNMNMRGQHLFDSLPVEIKKIYNNNYLEFLAEPERINQLNETDIVDTPVENVEKDVNDGQEQ